MEPKSWSTRSLLLARPITSARLPGLDILYYDFWDGEDGSLFY